MTTVALVLVALYVRTVNQGGYFVEPVLVGGAIGSFCSTFFIAIKGLREVDHASYSHIVVDSLLKVLKKGLAKGLKADVASALAPVIESDRWTDVYKTSIQREMESLLEKYPQTALLE